MITSLADHDFAQRDQALDTRNSFIIQAPAGSGKTSLLIQRFLSLLTQVNTPEEILAITFTKKAANEMRIRVIQALKQAQYEPEPNAAYSKKTWQLAKRALDRDQKLGWNLINTPNQLRIQTIDALSAYLTKQLPLLSHFGSQPDIANTPVLLYREAVQEVMTHIEEDFTWSSALAKLMLHLDNDMNKLYELLVSLLAKRDQWLPYIHLDTNTDEIKQQLETHLKYVISDSLKIVKKTLPKTISTELCAIARYAAQNLRQHNPESAIVNCLDITCVPNTLDGWMGLANLLLTDDKSWRKQLNINQGFPPATAFKNAEEKKIAQSFKQRAAELIAQLQEHESFRLALAELGHLPKATYQKSQWEILQALLQVLKIAAAQLRLTFQQHGQIDFIENTQAALVALGNDDTPTDLALALDYQIKHILIDEFQDTSLTQFQLLEKLTTGWEAGDGRTLFVVGDPMQSIYRFRNAEVGLFLRMQTHGIGQLQLIPLTLAINFRSTPQVVAWYNHHFQSIFPRDNNIATGAITYHPSVANHQDDAVCDSTIQIQGFTNENAQLQAQKIVDIIEQYPNEQIAILVRARHHLNDILPALKAANLPYQAIDIDPLAEKQYILDLLSLTSALTQPADRIAWLATLRAPWCGLTLADLSVVASDNRAAICSQLESTEVLQQISADGRKRIEKIYPILKQKMAERERQDLRTWIESTWLAIGGPACLHQASELDDVRCFFELLTELGQEQLSVNIDQLKLKIEKLFATPNNDQAKIQIMTIHSAKGLEFDTVILPHLDRKNAIDGHQLLLWMEQPLANDQIALLLAPIHATGDTNDEIYHYIQRQQQIKADHETDRLLYVAATRAKTNLYLLFDATQKENGDYLIQSGSFLKKLWPLIRSQANELIVNSQTDVLDDALSPLKPRYLTRLKSDWTHPIVSIPNATTARHVKSGGFQLTDIGPKVIGTVTHGLLQILATNGIAFWQQTTDIAKDEYIRKQLIQLGIAVDQLEAAIVNVQRMVQNVVSDSRGKWILDTHRDAKSEYAITATLGDEIENLIIDRTFVDADGVRWIIDYKTSSHEQGDLAAFLKQEEKKYREKMEKYAKAIRLIEDRPVKLGLYFPAIPAWHEVTAG